MTPINPNHPQPALRQPERITAAELRHLLRAMQESIDSLQDDIAQLRDGLTAAASQPAAPAAAATTTQHTGAIAIVQVDDITMSMDDAGKPVYKARGGQYTKFGVRIWPEVLPALQIDPASLRPGPNPVVRRVQVLLSDTGQPRKVIGLAD